MLLGLAGSLLKTLGKRNSKKNAQNMVGGGTDNSNDDQSNDQSNGEDIPRKYIIVADIKPLEDIRDDMKGSSKKKDPLNLALDGIDNALFGIIDTLGNIEKKKLDMADEINKAQQDKKKTLRERFLESGAVKGVVGAVKGAVGKSWDKFMQFIMWTFIGAIVNAIIKNWDEIQVEMGKVINQIGGLYKNLEPILKALVGFGKWIVVHGLKLMKGADLERTEKETEELKKLLDKAELLEKEANDLLRLVDNLDANDPKMKEFLNDYNNAKTKEERKELLDNFISENQTVWDPKTFIEDEDNPGEMLRFGETFGKPLTEEDKKNEIEEWKDMYYVDQHGNIRHKDTNGKAPGARLFPPAGLKYEEIKKMLEKRIYNKKTNTSTLTNTSSLDSRSLNNISSYPLGIEEYSDLSEVFGITNIIITGEEGSSSFLPGSSPIILSLFGEDSFTIDQALLLKLYNE